MKKFSRESHLPVPGNLHHNEATSFVKRATRTLNGDKLTLPNPRGKGWDRPDTELEAITLPLVFASARARDYKRVCAPL